ncbi:MAG: nucleoside-diphosphate kinase [Candidatus Cloacimonetes bacterium 4572_55]|nr:MAG: nucleoside-diphosphate kinase [Candidatus Cloacimonetes bacterium 4572_55]
MAKERTLMMIKPDAVKRGHIGGVVDMVEKNGFDIMAMKMIRFTKRTAGEFYAVHKARPFYDELVEFMSSGKTTVLVLEKENAILSLRRLLGDTDSQKAAPGTIRHKYGTDKGQNAAHGSDAPDTAAFEIGYHFSGEELVRL